MTLSAGVVPVRFKQDDWEFFLLRCYKYWDFPKGEVENGEEPFSAALRELAEESSIKAVKLLWGKTYYETERYSKGKIARYYIALVEGDPEIKLIPNPVTGIIEHHEYRWVKKDEALRLTNPRLQRVVAWAHGIVSQTSQTDHHSEI